MTAEVRKMNKTLKRTGLFACAALFLALTPMKDVHAAGEKKLPFSVTPIFSENQDQSVRGYFKVHTTSGEVQHLQVKIQNNKDTELTLELHPTNALTIVNGGINYDENKKNDSSSIIDDTYALASGITIPKELTLKKGEGKTINVDVISPKVTKGTVVGGIALKEKDTGDSTEVGSNGGVSFNIYNKVEFNMGIVLDYGSEVPDQLKIGEADIKSLPSGFQVYMKLINEAAKIEKELTLKYKVFNKNDEMLFEGSFEHFEMAPMTDVNYQVPWKAKEISEGDYKIDMAIEKNGKVLANGKSSFTVKNETIINIPQPSDNTPIVVKTQSGQNYWIYIAFGGLFLLALVLGILLGRRKK
jgi:hypothetical protein